MDILNFISWIASKRRIIKSLNDSDLIPVGVRNETRDDKYITVGITTEDFAASIMPPPTYKVYTALLTQSGTSNPIINEISDNIGLNVSFTRSSAGMYSANLGAVTTVLPISKTIIICSPPGLYAGGPNLYAIPTTYFSFGGPNVYLNLNIYYVDSLGNQTAADVLSAAAYKSLYLEIRVYN